MGAEIILRFVHRRGEVFSRWVVGLVERLVPIALAKVPASLVSVLLILGGIGVCSGLHQMTINLVATRVKGNLIFWDIFFQVDPTLLFPVWGAALAAETLGYYYWRRGTCKVCCRGALSQN